MDIESLRAEIPALENTGYMNWGASGPSPRHIVDAATSALEAHEFESPEHEGMYPAAFDTLDQTREAVGSFLGCAAEDVALTTSTMDGIARVATAIDWDPGDTVVRTDQEHPAGILPWRRLADVANVEVTVVPTDEGAVDREAYTDAVQDARLVTFSAISWLTGAVLPVSDLVDIAHEAGASVLVDAVQAPGQRPVSVADWGADYVVAAGHKWLLGPWGAGFLYGQQETIEELEPPVATYMGVEDPPGPGYTFRPGSRRLELGTLSPAPYAGLRAALETADEIGLDTIERRIADLTTRLVDGLPPERIHGPAPPESGLVSVRVDDPEATVTALADRDIVIRGLPESESLVRVSVHAYNRPETVEDVRAILQAHTP